MSTNEIIAQGFRDIAEKLEAAPEPTVTGPLNQKVVLIRNAPLDLKPYKWTPVPMDTFYGGGDPALIQGGYIRGAPGYWLYGAYIRLASNTKGQGIIQFVRDIEGSRDATGAQDWVPTPGKDFVTHTWFFAPIIDKPTGYEVYNGSPETLRLEYAQLKGVQIQ